MVRPLPKPEPDDDVAPFLSSYNPFRITLFILRRSLAYIFPPTVSLRIASHLVPLFVCLSLIPLILFFSIFSGWYIWKNIPVAWQVPIYLQYGDGPSPYAELSLPPLSTVQPYDVSLQLALPASEANFALGNFMATLSLSTLSNKTLITVSRPAIALPPRHATFSLSGIPRLVNLDVPLLSFYVPETSKMSARIDLGRRDGWKGLGNGEGRELSVRNAALRGVVRRHGIRGLVSHFPLTFAIVASATFFSLSVIVLAACIFPAIQWRVPVDQTLDTPEAKEDRPIRFRKRPRRNESRSASAVRSSRTCSRDSWSQHSQAYKTEDVPVDIPGAHASDSFSLKRRRSRMSDVLLDSED